MKVTTDIFLTSKQFKNLVIENISTHQAFDERSKLEYYIRIFSNEYIGNIFIEDEEDLSIDELEGIFKNLISEKREQYKMFIKKRGLLKLDKNGMPIIIN